MNLQPADIAELREALRGCGAEKRRVELGGNFTKRAMGGASADADVVVSTAGLNRVAQYEPRDLTVSVEAGLRFEELEDLLASNGQMLPLDPPLGAEATVGGVVAANCSGPRRRLYGAARDLVIGMTFVTLEGAEVRSGGMVVKNVAGLDMAKLLVGSFGTLAAIARVNFKVIPQPPETKTFVAAFASAGAALGARDSILRSVLQPAAVELANPEAAARLGVRLPEGFLLVVEAAGIEAVLARYDRDLKAIAREHGAAELIACEPDAARRLWRAARDFPALRASDAPGAAMLRVSTTLSRLGECLAATAGRPALARAASGIIYVYCASGGPQLAARLRSAGLYTVIESTTAGDKAALELWTEPGAELETMTRIKNALDPHHLLNHGRLYNRL